MHKIIQLFGLFLSVLLLTAACGNDPANNNKQQSKKLQAALQQLNNTFKEKLAALTKNSQTKEFFKKEVPHTLEQYMAQLSTKSLLSAKIAIMQQNISKIKADLEEKGIHKTTENLDTLEEEVNKLNEELGFIEALKEIMELKREQLDKKEQLASLQSQ